MRVYTMAFFLFCIYVLFAIACAGQKSPLSITKAGKKVLLNATPTVLAPKEVTGIYLGGKVKDADGKEVRNATVYIQGQEKNKVVTDAQGEFRILYKDESHVLVKKPQLVVVKEVGDWRIAGALPLPDDVMKHAKQEATLSDPLTLQSPSLVKGKVLLHNQSRHDGVKVSIPGTLFSVTTDASGEFTLHGIPEGTWDVVFEKEGYQTAIVRYTSLRSNLVHMLSPLTLVPQDKTVRASVSLAGIDFAKNKVLLSFMYDAEVAFFRVFQEGEQTNNWNPIQEYYSFFPQKTGEQSIFVQFKTRSGQLSQVFSLNVNMGDSDGDGIGDLYDCAPLDKTRFVLYSNLYRDEDGDGKYGVKLTSVCGGGSIPAGYLRYIREDMVDCNDSDPQYFEWKILWRDENGDGFGDGEEVAVCTNGTIPSGFTATPPKLDDALENAGNVPVSVFTPTQTFAGGYPLPEPKSIRYPLSTNWDYYERTSLADKDIVVISFYQSYDPQYNKAINLRIKSFERPTVLVLSAYTSTLWRIYSYNAEPLDSLNITEIFIYGYDKQEWMFGSASTIPVSKSTYEENNEYVLGATLYSWPIRETLAYQAQKYWDVVIKIQERFSLPIRAIITTYSATPEIVVQVP